VTDEDSAPLTDREYQALARFRHALRVFLRFSEQAARAEGLTPAQHQLLLAVRGRPAGPPSIGELAEVLQLRNHSVVGLVERAAAAGLLTTEMDPTDGRRRIVALTPAGLAVVERLSAMHRRELRTFRNEMGDVLRELD
jgi:DNA-binding MarR family transcriptional regulator